MYQPSLVVGGGLQLQVLDMAGGFSGGTIHSGISMLSDSELEILGEHKLRIRSWLTKGV